jgi:hypothetical protein
MKFVHELGLSQKDDERNKRMSMRRKTTIS